MAADTKKDDTSKQIVVDFSGEKFALIVRGKTGIDHEPDLLAQHADVILPDGNPIGFFGEGEGTSGSGGSTGFGMDGVVYDHGLLKIHRPYYVNVGKARKYKIKSTVLVLKASKSEAQLFKKYWTELKTKPGGFRILGDNCSTHASEAFISAGVANKGIPGLDTPDNLFKQLKALRPKAEVYSGYIGFRKRGDNAGYDLIIEQ